MNENYQYWINQDGVQAGPVTREQLKDMAIDDKAYVWRAGMEDWCRITELTELEGLYSSSQQTDVAPEQPAEVSELAEAPEAAVVPPMVPQPEAVQPPYAHQQPQYAAQQPAAQPVAVEQPKCPPTNLVWAILSTILCCLPLGVVAIIYSTKVSQKYQQGDLAAAEHYSEVSAWWCIGSIIGGIVMSPFVSLIQMAMMQ